jgi:hypothetical protein
MKRIVSKTTKNYLTIFQDPHTPGLVFIINIDNNYIVDTYQSSYSYLSIFSLQDEYIFDNNFYERITDLQWNICAVHNIKGIIKDV